MTTPLTAPAGYFDAMYQAAADPWGFKDRWYEQRKYAISLALLPAVRYRRAFEPGCSIGVLTRMLAGRCDEPDFLAEVYIRTEGMPVSVAEATGLV